MPKQIDSEKVIERINERINSLPQSRVELGGFHSGQLAAYQNIIDDLRTGTFDPTPVQPDTEEDVAEISEMLKGMKSNFDQISSSLQGMNNTLDRMGGTTYDQPTKEA